MFRYYRNQECLSYTNRSTIYHYPNKTTFRQPDCVGRSVLTKLHPMTCLSCNRSAGSYDYIQFENVTTDIGNLSMVVSYKLLIFSLVPSFAPTVPPSIIDEYLSFNVTQNFYNISWQIYSQTWNGNNQVLFQTVAGLMEGVDKANMRLISPSSPYHSSSLLQSLLSTVELSQSADVLYLTYQVTVPHTGSLGYADGISAYQDLTNQLKTSVSNHQFDFRLMKVSKFAFSNSVNNNFFKYFVTSKNVSFSTPMVTTYPPVTNSTSNSTSNGLLLPLRSILIIAIFGFFGSISIIMYYRMRCRQSQDDEVEEDNLDSIPAPPTAAAAYVQLSPTETVAVVGVDRNEVVVDPSMVKPLNSREIDEEVGDGTLARPEQLPKAKIIRGSETVVHL